MKPRVINQLIFLGAIIFSYFAKDFLTPLLFQGRSFERRSVEIQALLFVFYFFAFIVVAFLFLWMSYGRGSQNNTQYNFNNSKPRILFGLISVFAFFWLIFVFLKYFSVDGGNLSKTLQTTVFDVLFSYFFVFLSFVSILKVLKLLQQNYFKALFAIVFASLFLSKISSLWASIGSFNYDLSGLSDGEKTFVLIACSSMLGFIFSAILELIKRELQVWVLAYSYVLLFFGVSMAAGSLPQFFVLCILFMLSDAIGIFFVRFSGRYFDLPTDHIESVWLLTIASGLSFFILLVFLLGVLGMANYYGLLALLIFVAALTPQYIKSSLLRFNRIPWQSPVRINNIEISGLFALGGLLLIYWVSAVAPEVGADALGFRTAGPLIWMREGHIHPLPEMLGSYGQFAGEMLFLLTMPIAGLSVAKVIQFGLFVLLCVGTYVFIVEKEFRVPALYLIFPLWSSNLIWWQMAWGFVDVVQLFFFVSSILALEYWANETDNRIWLIITGVVSAVASMVKLNGAGALVVALLVIIFLSVKRKYSFLGVFLNISTVGVSSLVIMLPWLLRSYILTRNPFFPFALNIFKSPLLETMPIAKFGVGLSFPDVLLIPWDIFITPQQFGSLGSYNPFFLGGLIFALAGLTYRWSFREVLWGGVGCFSFGLWLLSDQNTRYSLNFGFYFALLFGLGVARFMEKRQDDRIQNIIQSIFWFAILLGFGLHIIRPTFWMAGNNSGPLLPVSVVFGGQTNDEYLRAFVPDYMCANWLNSHYGSNVRLLQLSSRDRDHLYFNGTVSVLPHAVAQVAEPIVKLLSIKDDYIAIHRFLIENGYTHLLYNSKVKNVYLPGWTGIVSEDFEKKFLTIECADRNLRLFKILEMPRAVSLESGDKFNLIENGEFDLDNVNSNGLNGWAIQGESRLRNNNGDNSLELINGAVISQMIDVVGGDLYKFSMEVESTDFDAFVQMNWIDSDQKLILFSRNEIEIPDLLGSQYYFFQKPPAEADKIVIYIGGNNVVVDDIKFGGNLIDYNWKNNE